MAANPSPEHRVARGSVVVLAGVLALFVPLLIGDWGVLFVFACAPMGLFIVAIGVVEIVRGFRQARSFPRER